MRPLGVEPRTPAASVRRSPAELWSHNKLRNNYLLKVFDFAFLRINSKQQLVQLSHYFFELQFL